MRQNGNVLELLKGFEKMGIPVIDCAVYHRGECVFRHRVGYSDEACTRPVDGSERYNIYSCSKPVTCAAALQLVESGAVGLDDAVYEYLPEFRHMTKCVEGKIEEVRNTMTVRNLFTMTAGFTYNTNSENLRRGQEAARGALSTREAMKYLAQDPLSFEPGTRWQYSLCHDVLAALVEVVSGERFGLYVKKNIFGRVGMTHSTFLLPEEQLGEIAAQYHFRADEEASDPQSRSGRDVAGFNADGKPGTFSPCGPRIQGFMIGSRYESGGAGCISTVDDYIRFLEALRSGERLLRRDTIAAMTRPQIGEEAAKSYWVQGYSYGLGVRCPTPGGAKRDYGWGGAAGAFLAVLPEAEATIFHAQHVLGSPNQGMRYSLVDALLEDLRD